MESATNIIINGRFKVLEQIAEESQAEIFKTLDLNDNKMYWNSVLLFIVIKFKQRKFLIEKQSND